MKKGGILLVVLISFGLLFYWVKFQWEINFFESVSFSQYLPFDFLKKKNNIVPASKVGDLLKDSFDSSLSQYNWAKLWMREEGSVVQDYQHNQGIDSSRCLFVQNRGNEDWAFKHRKLIAVNTGDVFSYEGYVKSAGKQVNSELSVTLYNEQREVIDWSYATTNTGKSEKWTKLTERFEIPPNVHYIRFRLTGSGVGTSWVDDIVLRREQRGNSVQ